MKYLGIIVLLAVTLMMDADKPKHWDNFDPWPINPGSQINMQETISEQRFKELFGANATTVRNPNKIPDSVIMVDPAKPFTWRKFSFVDAWKLTHTTSNWWVKGYVYN